MATQSREVVSSELDVPVGAEESSREEDKSSATSKSSQSNPSGKSQSNDIDTNEVEKLDDNTPDAAKADEQTSDLNKQTSQPLHSVFSRRWKSFIILMAATGAFLSPLGTFIYFPALNTMADFYHVSPSKINLTITTYMIFQAIAPMFFGDFGDQRGHRPALVVALVIFFAANVGLALQSSYTALLVLRCLQSTGASGTVALRNGVIAEVYSPAERGTYLGIINALTLVAPAFAPVVGGVLTKFLGWRSVFWFLVIFSGVYMVPYILFQPETNRKIVGNGSIKPDSWWNKSLLDYVKPGATVPQNIEQTTGDKPQKLKSIKPWRTLAVLKEKDASLILFYAAISYALLYTFLTSTPVLFRRVYGFDEIQIGFCYIPAGMGGAVAAIINGKMLDRNYRRIAAEEGFPYDKKRRQDLRRFPIEKARLQICFPFAFLGIICLLPYGWILEHRLNLAGPLVLQFILGVSAIGSSSCFNNLLVDLYPQSPSTVSAASNLTRCLFGAAASALINPMIDSLGVGWTFTLVALVALVLTPLLWLELKKGPQWREARYVKREKREQEKAERAIGTV